MLLLAVQAAEALDGGSRFEHEPWQRPTGSPNPGHGVTAVLEGGTLLEKVHPLLPHMLHVMGKYSHQSSSSSLLLWAPQPEVLYMQHHCSSADAQACIAPLQAAVSTTFVRGTLSAQRAKAMSSRGRSIDQEGGQSYSAAALSLVFHPAHPHVPTLRADVRRFEVHFGTEQTSLTWWCLAILHAARMRLLTLRADSRRLQMGTEYAQPCKLAVLCRTPSRSSSSLHLLSQGILGSLGW